MQLVALVQQILREEPSDLRRKYRPYLPLDTPPDANRLTLTLRHVLQADRRTIGIALRAPFTAFRRPHP